MTATLTSTRVDPPDPPAHGPADVRLRLESLAERHDPHSATFRAEALAQLKRHVATERGEARAQLEADGHGTACAKRLAQIQDALIEALFDFAGHRIYPADNPSTGERLSIVAVGGYGRGTLAPASDIDLLFVLPYKQTAWGESVVEYLLYMLWDLGFKVGHATRSIDDCIRLAKGDATIKTSILEARYICGDRALFDELWQRFRAQVVEGNARGYIAEKLAERDARHHRAGASRYVVEPDVKDGKGGLRDLHTLFWIAKFVYGTQRVRDLVEAGVFTRKELRRFMRCEDFLWAVRCHMHFMTGRADDRLDFDKQAELAGRLGYTGHGGLRHVERFMKHYFLVSKEVGDLTRIFCAVLEAQEIKKAPTLNRILAGLKPRWPDLRLLKDKDFKLAAGRLDVVDDEVFARDPVNLVRLFHLADRRGCAIHPRALQLVRRSLKLVDDALRTNEQANALFLDMLCDSADPEVILRRMSEAGVLGRFIPEFGRIVAMMQFNMYHHYTVDEHLIRAVGLLSRIDHGTFEEDHPLATRIFPTITDKRALYVAMLLHDIGKGRKEHHCVVGERIARSLCPRLGLTSAETETVAWLVRHHLLMSETSQMRDLNDFKTILDFAAVVQSLERLKLLLILTVADIRAVGPGVWNGWKGQLLRTLYNEAEPLLDGGHGTISRNARLEAAQQAFRDRMAEWDATVLQRYIERHYEAYWLDVDLDHQVAHAELIEAARQGGEPVAIRYSTSQFLAMTELTIFTPDHPRLLALLTGACAAAGANIASAQIFTTADGMALDTLRLQRQFDEDMDENRRAERVCTLIRKAISGEIRVRQLVAQAPPQKGRIKAFMVEPQAVVDNRSSNRYTLIEVAGLDRIGLLYDLTEALFRLNLDIASAHIATFGERAVDVFYVTDLTGAKITDAGRQKTIRRQLMQVLRPPAEHDAAAPAV